MAFQTNKDATRARRIYKQRKALGLCTSCGKAPAGPVSVSYCDACRIRKNKVQAKRTNRLYHANVKVGVCGMCKAREAMQGRKWCGYCAEMHTERQAARRKEWAEKGLCRRCGGSRPCENCKAEYRRRNAIWKARAKANGKCPSCGKKAEGGYVTCSACRERVSASDKARRGRNGRQGQKDLGSGK